ncbi:Protein of unknown function [Pyronema omphalodes CBS 100304]|uniref:Uncharacterized protein n=1 Tax=Pyronema omphalodes (strain CBS 100304) TaxID=1076935 RepID=U4KZ51_PYROM|nr:Protein of unknown function [Pyronema omphalodes CBS 100304]
MGSIWTRNNYVKVTDREALMHSAILGARLFTLGCFRRKQTQSSSVIRRLGEVDKYTALIKGTEGQNSKLESCVSRVWGTVRGRYIKRSDDNDVRTLNYPSRRQSRVSLQLLQPNQQTTRCCCCCCIRPAYFSSFRIPAPVTQTR